MGHEAVARRGAAEAACGKCYCVQYSVHLATWHEEIRRWTGSFLIGVVLLQNPVLRTMWRPLQSAVYFSKNEEKKEHFTTS